MTLLKNPQRTAFRLAALCCLLSAVVLASLSVGYFQKRTIVLHEEEQRARDRTIAAATFINEELSALSDIVNWFATDLSTMPDSWRKLPDSLLDIARMNSLITGVGVAFKPYTYDKSIRLYAPYYVRHQDRYDLKRIDAAYDYTNYQYDYDILGGDRKDWYRQCLQSSRFVEPFMGEFGQGHVIGYCAPFNYPLDHEDSEQSRGVVLATVSVEALGALLRSLDMESIGYAYLTNASGQFIAHPNKSYVESKKNCMDILGTRSGEMLAAPCNAQKWEEGAAKVYDNALNSDAWLFVQPVRTADWRLGTVTSADMGHEVVELRELLSWITFSGSITLVFALLAFAIGLGHRGESILWLTSVTISAVFICGIGVLWFLKLSEPVHSSSGKNIVYDEVGLDKFRLDHSRLSLRMYEDLPFYVPTGIFIQSIELTDVELVQMQGYIWQSRPSGQRRDLKPDIVFPDALSSEMELAYHKDDGNTKTIGWRFNLTTQEQPDYSHYPFDFRNIEVRLSPPAGGETQVLIPDIEAYRFINPTAKPGLDQGIKLSGWEIESSFFSFLNQHYNTSFGTSPSTLTNQSSELHFNVVLRREFMGPFVSNIIPLMVIASMIFFTFFVAKRNGTQVVGFTFTLSITAALFFGALLAHNRMRYNLEASQIMYIEYYHFIIYFCIFLLPLNALVFTRGLKTKYLYFMKDHAFVKNNIVGKLCFWPVSSGLYFCITFIHFY